MHVFFCKKDALDRFRSNLMYMCLLCDFQESVVWSFSIHFVVGESGQADLKAEHVCPGKIESYRGVVTWS